MLHRHPYPSQTKLLRHSRHELLLQPLESKLSPSYVYLTGYLWKSFLSITKTWMASRYMSMWYNWMVAYTRLGCDKNYMKNGCYGIGLTSPVWEYRLYARHDRNPKT